METRVFNLSAEAFGISSADFIREEFKSLFKSFLESPTLVEHSKVVSDQDEYGIACTIANLEYYSHCAITTPYMFLYDLQSTLINFRDYHFNYMTKEQDNTLCKIIDLIYDISHTLVEMDALPF
jgi:hypothetical protein